jgi:4-carboxymuconolactone decarboxylase
VTRIVPADLPDDLPVRNNLVRATYTNPEMHRGFASLSGRVHSASHLPARTRELVVLRVANLLGAEYERQQHERAARHVGVSESELAALRSGDIDAFDGAERAALQWAGAVERCAVDEAVWEEARRHFSEVELSDLTLLAGFYGLAARYVLALDIDLDEP